MAQYVKRLLAAEVRFYRLVWQLIGLLLIPDEAWDDIWVG